MPDCRVGSKDIPKGKGKGKCTYIALFLQYLILKALRHGSHSVTYNYTNAYL